MHRSIRILRLSFLLAGLSAAHAQVPAGGAPAPARQHSVSLDVKTVSSGGGTKVASKSTTQHGALTGVGGVKLTTNLLQNKTDQNHRVALEITARNFSPQPDEVQLECYFFAAPVNGTKEFIFDSNTKTLTLQGGENQISTVESKEVTSTTVKSMVTADGYNTSAFSRVEQSGNKLKGWLVRLIADGKVIQIRASQSKYEDLGRNDTALNALKAQPPKK